MAKYYSSVLNSHETSVNAYMSLAQKENTYQSGITESKKRRRRKKKKAN